MPVFVLLVPQPGDGDRLAFDAQAPAVPPLGTEVDHACEVGAKRGPGAVTDAQAVGHVHAFSEIRDCLGNVAPRTAAPANDRRSIDLVVVFAALAHEHNIGVFNGLFGGSQGICSGQRPAQSQ